MNPPQFGVYVHWPYCARICPYCDFNVYRARNEDPAALIGAIAADLIAHRERIGPRQTETVFLGGGTPSLLRGAQIAQLLDAIDRAFPIAPGAEITLEANPEDHGRFADHVAAGVNRLSLGVQALRDDALAALFRSHRADEARTAVIAAAATGARVSIDMIYARPGQSVAAWALELREALGLPAEHLSLYQLTIEPGTAFARAEARGAVRPPDAETAAALYERTEALCAEAGLTTYEVSNVARGPSAQARHNVLYWTGGEYVGVGPGAHGRVRQKGVRFATRAAAKPGAYVAAVAARGVGWEEAERLSPLAIRDERLLMGLRLQAGVPIGELDPPPLPAKRAALVELGLLENDATRLALTRAGRLVANRVALELASD